MPPKGRSRLTAAKKERNTSEAARVINLARLRERRARMTEAERNVAREKNRISAKLRRALMNKEELDQIRKKQRESTRLKRKERKLVPLQQELESIKSQLQTLLQSDNPDHNEQEQLETQKAELEVQIKEIVDAPPNSPIYINNNDTESPSAACHQNQESSDVVDDPSCSDSETDDFANHTLYKVVDGIAEEVTMSDQDYESTEDGDQKMRANETIQEWVQRMSNPSTDKRKGTRRPNDGTFPDESKDPTKDDSKIRKGRLIVMRAKAKLFKLQTVTSRESKDEKQERCRQLEAQKRIILKLISKYPQEFNVHRSQNMAKQRRQRKNEIASITRNNKNIRSKGTETVGHQVQLSRSKKSFLRFNIPRYETKARKIQRIAEKLKFNGANFDNDTPEEFAARVLNEIEDAKEKYKIRKQTSSGVPSNIHESGRGKTLDSYMESYKLKQILETPESRAERCAKLAAYARVKNKMEKREYNLFLTLISSEDPVKSLEDDQTTLETVDYWHNFKTNNKGHKLPDCLKEWRNKIYLLLNSRHQENELEDEKKLRLTKMNEGLKKWLDIHGNELKEYLTNRKNKFNIYLKKRNHTMTKVMTEEEKEERRKKLNAYFREKYQKAKLAQGISITPKGERPHPNKYYKSTEEKSHRAKTSRKSRNSISDFSSKRKNVSKSKRLSLNFKMSESDTDTTDTTSPGLHPPPPPSVSSTPVTPAQCDVLSTAVGWPTFSLVNPSVNEGQPHQKDLDDDNGSDDWIPVSNYSEQSYSTVNQNHGPSETFGSNQYPSGPTQNISQQGYDDLFHRLLQAPCQNNFSNFMPHVPVYPPTIEGLTVNHPTHNSANSQQPQLQESESQPIQQLRQPNVQHLSQPIDVPLNYSVPFHQTTDIEVPWIVGTVETIPKGNPDFGPSDERGGSNDNIPPELEVKCEFPNSTLVNSLPLTKVKRKRRAQGSAPIKRARSKKPIVENIFPPKGAVHISTTSSPIVISAVGTTEILASRLKCKYCPMVFNSEIVCSRHIKRFHETTTKHVCKVCNQHFEKNRLLVQHIWGCHRKLELYRCPVCSKEYVKRYRFLAHLKLHPSEKNSFILGITSSSMYVPDETDKFCCNVCPSVFDSYLKAVIHRETHKYICTSCGIILKDRDHLLEHTFRCHPEVDWRGRMEDNFYKPVEDVRNTFTCLTCDSQFLTQKFLSIHEAAGHPRINLDDDIIKPEENYCPTCDTRYWLSVQDHSTKCAMKNFPCYWCNEVFNRGDLRLRHMIKNHLQDKSIPKIIQGGYKKYKCELCRRSYDSILSVRYHFEEAHIPNISRRRIQPVDELDKSVDVQSPNDETTNLEIVQTKLPSSKDDPQNDTPLVVYPCTICYSNYKTEAFLQQHVSSEHPDRLKHYRFLCEICNKTFSDASVLRRHKRTFHNANSNSAARKKHQCPHCPAQLTRAEHLRKHVTKIHETPNSLRQVKHMHRQQEISGGTGKQFICEVCSSSFTYKKGLSDHIKRNHGPRSGTLFCEICGKQINTFTPGHSLKRHMMKVHPEHADSVQTPHPRFAFGTGLKRFPIPEVLKLIDEIHAGHRCRKKLKKSDFAKKDRASIINKNSKKKTKISATDDKAKEFYHNEDDSEFEEDQSDRDWFSGHSSSDDCEEEECDLVSESNLSDMQSSRNQNSRKISLKNVVIIPKKRKRSSRPTRLQKFQQNVNELPSIVFEKCDGLKKECIRTPDAETRRRTRPSNSTKRFIFDTDASDVSE